MISFGPLIVKVLPSDHSKTTLEFQISVKNLYEMVMRTQSLTQAPLISKYQASSFKSISMLYSEKLANKTMKLLAVVASLLKETKLLKSVLITSQLSFSFSVELGLRLTLQITLLM